MSPTKKPVLASNISRLRKSSGYTQDDFAAHTGISISTLKDIERGASPGSLPTLEVIAQALGCTVEDLYQKPAPLRMPDVTDVARFWLETISENERLKAQIKDLERIADELRAWKSRAIDDGYLPDIGLKKKDPQSSSPPSGSSGKRRR